MNPCGNYGVASLSPTCGAGRVDLAISRYNFGRTHFLNVVGNERQIYEIHEKFPDAQMAL
jgi:hypothetical protein